MAKRPRGKPRPSGGSFKPPTAKWIKEHFPSGLSQLQIRARISKQLPAPAAGPRTKRKKRN